MAAREIFFYKVFLKGMRESDSSAGAKFSCCIRHNIEVCSMREK